MSQHTFLQIKISSHRRQSSVVDYNFISNRTIRTLVGSALSNSCPLGSGVVQGSYIGPLLFVLYVNYVEKMFLNSTTTKYFADDLKLYTELESNVTNATLQKELDLLNSWCIKWQLTISIKNVLSFMSEPYLKYTRKT